MVSRWWIEEQEALLLKRLIEFGSACRTKGCSQVFLGMMPISREDLIQIEATILTLLQQDPVSGPALLAEKAPAHLALFLVWQGIKGYQDGDYWSAVHEIVGITDKYLEARWGGAFLEFLERQNLPSGIDVGGHKYVTSILLHGGIPDSCLPEYFREVVWNLFVRNGRTEEEDVLENLYEMRRRANELRESGLLDRLEELQAEERKCQRALKLIEESIRCKKELRNARAKRELAEQLAVNGEKLTQLKQEQKRLLERLIEADEAVRAFNEKDKKLVASSGDAERFAFNLQNFKSEFEMLRSRRKNLQEQLDRVARQLFVRTGWDDSWYNRLTAGQSSAMREFWYAVIIWAHIIVSELLNRPVPHLAREGQQLLDELQDCLAKLNRLLASLNEFAANLEAGMVEVGSTFSPCTVAIKNCFAGTLDSNLDETEQELTIKFAVLEERVNSWLMALREAKFREQRAIEAERELNELGLKMRVLESEIESLCEDFKKKARRFSLDYVHDGIDVRALKNLVVELTTEENCIKAELKQKVQTLRQLLGKEVQIDELEAERFGVLQALDGIRKERERLFRATPASPLINVDKPIQRFLLYGGEAAEEFLLHTVRVLSWSCEAGYAVQPPNWPQSYRYECIWIAFQEWWAAEGNHLCTPQSKRNKPRLVCWRKETQWYVGVQLPEEVSCDIQLSVIQDGQELEPFPGLEECWALVNLEGRVEVTSSNGTSAVLALEELRQRGEPCFVFRGWDDRVAPLPVMKNLSTKKFVTIVPDTWRYEEHSVEGSAYGPEPVAISGYAAYLFDLSTEDKKISFAKPDGRVFHLEFVRTCFKLDGQQLFLPGDLDLGPLFVKEPPRLHAFYEDIWDEVGSIALVNMRNRKDKYQKLEIPSEVGNEIILPLDRLAGCYWVVILHKNGEEVERLPFRYVAHLEEVHLKPNPVPFCPPEDGHGEVVIEFVAFDSIFICPARGKDITPKKIPGGIIAVVPPDPRYDVSEWEIISPEGLSVPLRLVLERIWWCVADECQDLETIAWSDRTLKLKREWFQATSKKALFLRWSWQRVGAKVEVLAGFDKATRLSYRALSRGPLRWVKVPLREFCDSEGLRRNVPFKLWFVEARRGEFASTVVGLIEIPDDPERRKSCATCDFARHRRGWCWCRKEQWPCLPKVEFDQYRASYVCDEWQGEFLNEEGIWN